MSGRFEGKQVLVTGGATGIGRKIADRFVSEGALVTVFGLPSPEMDAIRAGAAQGITAVDLDLNDTSATKSAIDALHSRIDALDVFVNNAAVAPTEPVYASAPDHWDAVRRVNLDAFAQIVRRVTPPMIEKRAGNIIAISSVHATHAQRTASAYAGTKGAINAMTRAFALDLAPYGIRCNAIAPGFVRTPMSFVDGVDETTTEQFKKVFIEGGRLPLARPADPSEIASVAAFLASEDASYITGQVLTVDGGLTVTF